MFSPTSEIDGGGAQHIRRGQPSPIKLVIWVELGPKPRYVVGSCGPGPEGPSARGYSEPGRIPLRTLTSGIGAHGQKNLKYLMGPMVTGEPVNVSEVTRFVCDMERWTRGLDNDFRRSHGVL